jgi:orotate phosphoribosyltransferase
VALLRTYKAQAAGVVIALDRQERGQGELSAIQEVERLYSMPVLSIVGLNDLLEYLRERPNYSQPLAAIRAYRARYGT